MNKKSLGESKPVYIRLPLPLVEECERIAKQEYWTMTDVMRESVKCYLKKRKEGKK